MLGFGFISGLPLPLSTFTLHQWLSVSGAAAHTVGLSAVLALPYTLKFLWAPAFDRAPPWPRAGRRRSWLMLVQPLLVLAVVVQAITDPARSVGATAAATLAVSFFSASQDILIDAWRIDTFSEREQGTALAAYVWGYRVALAVASPGVIWASTRVGWHVAIGGIAVLLAGGMALTWIAPEPAEGARTVHPGFADAIWRPLQNFLARPAAGWLLAFVILFLLGKVFADTMAAPFYRSLGFDSAQVGAANFAPSLLGTFGGAALGGWLVARVGARRAVLLAGTVQAASLGLYLALGAAPTVAMLFVKVGGEYFAAGAANTAFLAFVSTLCSREYSASQYALLSSLAAVAFHVLATGAGYGAEALGWMPFFAGCIILSLPALAILNKTGSRAVVP